jgi:hypothetical protein
LIDLSSSSLFLLLINAGGSIALDSSKFEIYSDFFFVN